jgi:hypothetical protein
MTSKCKNLNVNLMEFVQIVKDTNNHKNKNQKKGWSLIFKKGTTQDYMIQKQEHKMCTTNMKMDFYYANVYKHEHEKNLRRLLCKIMPKNCVTQTKRNEGSYSYLYPFGDLAQGSFQGGFYVCIK